MPLKNYRDTLSTSGSQGRAYKEFIREQKEFLLYQRQAIFITESRLKIYNREPAKTVDLIGETSFTPAVYSQLTL